MASIRTSGDNKSGSYELQVTFTRENHPPGTYYARLQGIRDIFGNTASSLFINDIVINHENVAPQITSEPIFSADENQLTIGTVEAIDSNGDTISYEISGNDASLISINSSNGELQFISAPNYEVKNSYSATVSVTDGVDTTTQDITVNVTDVNDMPVATAASYYLNLLPQDQSGGNITLSATDEDGDTLTYSIVNDVSYGSTSISGATVTYLTSEHNLKALLSKLMMEQLTQKQQPFQLI